MITAARRKAKQHFVNLGEIQRIIINGSQIRYEGVKWINLAQKWVQNALVTAVRHIQVKYNGRELFHWLCYY